MANLQKKKKKTYLQPCFRKIATMLRKKCNDVENLLLLGSCSLTFFCKSRYAAYLGVINETIVGHDFDEFWQDFGL